MHTSYLPTGQRSRLKEVIQMQISSDINPRKYWFSLQFEKQIFDFIVGRNNGSRVLHLDPGFSIETPCFPPDPVFSTRPRVFHTPCFPHPGTPYLGTPVPRFPPSQASGKFVTYRGTFIFDFHNCGSLLPEVRYEVQRLESSPIGSRPHKSCHRSFISSFCKISNYVYDKNVPNRWKINNIRINERFTIW